MTPTVSNGLSAKDKQLLYNLYQNQKKKSSSPTAQPFDELIKVEAPSNNNQTQEESDALLVQEVTPVPSPVNNYSVTSVAKPMIQVPQVDDDELNHRLALQNFTQQMEEKLGVDPIQLVEAFSRLTPEELLSPPEQSVSQVVAQLPLNEEQKKEAYNLFHELLKKTASHEMGRYLQAPERQISLEILSEAEIKKRALNDSLDQMSHSFFVDNKALRQSPVTEIKPQGVVLKDQVMPKRASLEKSNLEGSQFKENKYLIDQSQISPYQFETVGENENVLKGAFVKEDLGKEVLSKTAVGNENGEDEEQLLMGEDVLNVSGDPDTEVVPNRAAKDPSPSPVPSSIPSGNGITESLQPKVILNNTESFSDHKDLGDLLDGKEWEEGSGQIQDLKLIPPQKEEMAMRKIGKEMQEKGDNILNKKEDSFPLHDKGDSLTQGVSSWENSGHQVTSSASTPFAVQTPKMTNAQETANWREVMDHAQVLVKSGGGEMKIKLNPEGVGEVTLKVVTDGGRVNVEMIASNSETKKMLERGIGDLKETLSIHKLNLDQVKVSSPDQLSKHLDQQLGDSQQRMAQQFREEFHQNNQGWRQGLVDLPPLKSYPSQTKGEESDQNNSPPSRPRLKGQGSRLHLVA